MQLQLAIYTPVTNILLEDWSTRIKSCSIRSGVHGYESCEATINIPFYEAFLYYQQLGPLKLRVSWGSYRVWEGRLEDPTQFANTSSGLKITAFGGWVAFNDAPYTALWSETQVGSFRPVLTSETPTAYPDRYAFNTSNQLFITAQKNATFGNTGTGKQAMLCYQLPDQGSKSAIGVSFDYEYNLPAANWRVAFQNRNADFTGITSPWIIIAAGATGLVVGTINITFTAAQVVNFFLDFGAADAVYAGETGTTYLKITNFRLVTSTTNRISTTLGTNIAAGTRTVTPASMARIYVGQRLNIDQGSVTVGESVLVTAITATTFTAVFVFAHVIASTVTAHVVYPDEIIKDCVTTLNTLNSTQVDSDVTLIQSQAVDLDQALYEDQYPTEIINSLLTKSDNQTPPRQWVALVYNDQRLIVRPRGTGFAWYVDITSLEIVRTLTELYNSAYSVYKDVANKRNLRSSVNSDAPSAAKFQITRRQAIEVDTTSVTQAEKIRDSVLALQLDPTPRASVEIDRVFDATGTPFPLHFVHADDTLTIRNLPPTLGGTFYDKIRTLVITRTDVDLIRNTIKLELEIPMPNLDVQLAQALGKK